MEKFIFDEKEYNVPEFDFNALCELGDRGLDFTEMQNGETNGLKIIRALLSFALDKAPKETGTLITKEIVKVGIEKFTENLQPLVNGLTNSDFFKQLVK